jgi:hypothetical protein
VEELNEGKVVAYHVFSDLKCWKFLPMTSHYGAALFTLSIVKCYGHVATLIGRQRGDVSREGGRGSEGDVGTTVGEVVVKETQVLQEGKW